MEKPWQKPLMELTTPDRGLESLISEPGKKIDMPQHLIITTVGTSVFTNFNKEEVKKAFEEKGKGYQKLNLSERESDSAQEYDVDIFGTLEKCIKDKWLKGINKKDRSGAFTFLEDAKSPNPHASAEITSILKIAEKLRAQDEEAQVEVQLLATDTALSVSAAKLVKLWFGKEVLPGEPTHYQHSFEQRSENHSVSISIRPFQIGENGDYIKSLGVKPPADGDPETFYEQGLQNLVKKLVDKQSGLIKQAKQARKDKLAPVINFSGGYKAIIPFLTIIAQLENIPMYYIYEDSDHLLEMGSLPVGWDWGMVEALKPLLKNYILKKNEFQQLAQAIKHGKVHFSAETQLYVPKEEEDEWGLPAIPSNFHLALFNLRRYKLIDWKIDPKNENLLSITPLGRIMNNVNPDIEKGYVMEHLLFKYFSLENKPCALTQPYQSILFRGEYPRNFRIDKSTKQLQFESNKDGDTREIGDIDLALSKGDRETMVWAESKAFSAACVYLSEIGKPKDYLFQLKARGLALYQAHSQPTELLFLVFRFVIPGITDREGFLESDHFKRVLTHLTTLNTDPDLSGKSSFRCMGISIPVGFKGEQLDLTDFYKGNFHRWVFEEIKPELANIS
jgi:CRISPR/Cas system-associated protein Csm6